MGTSAHVPRPLRGLLLYFAAVPTLSLLLRSYVF